MLAERIGLIFVHREVFRQVLPGVEGVPRAAEDHEPNVRVLRKFVDNDGQIAEHLGREQRRAPIAEKAHGRDVFVAFEFDRCDVIGLFGG